MRVSSATFPFSRGTLKSARMKTRFPFKLRSRMESLLIRSLSLRKASILESLSHHFYQVDAAARIAPLVVVPRENLHIIRVHDACIAGIENGRMRIAAKINGNKWFFRIFQKAFIGAVGGFAKSSIHFLDSHWFAADERQIDQADVRSRHTQCITIQPAF